MISGAHNCSQRHCPLPVQGLAMIAAQLVVMEVVIDEEFNWPHDLRVAQP